jgi:hypothetical protein
MWATAEESREQIVAAYRRAWAYVEAAVDALGLGAVGRVPWWGPGGREVSLHRVLLHVAVGTHRHAGHADIVREPVGGSVGLQTVGDNLPEHDEGWWRGYRERLERVAGEARRD